MSEVLPETMIGAKQAQRWTEVFTQPNKDGKISVYTPSLRDGWWNVMSSNLAAQTHKNFEWIIVDAQEQSREATAKKVCSGIRS